MAILIPIGLRNGAFVHISEVDRGLDCDCLCPECNMPLVAKKGLKREHHFAHASTTYLPECVGNVESVLHKYAKQIIAEVGYLAVPAFEVMLPPPDSDLKVEIPARHMVFTRVDVEESMLFGRHRVDVVGYSNESRLLIEICVTHRVRGKKLREVKAASEAMVEIVVPRNGLYSQISAGEGSLRYLILDSLDNKRWLFHPEGEEARSQLKRQARDRHAVPPSMSGVLVEDPIKPNGESGHVPSREGLSSEGYVRAMHEFLATSRYTEETRQRVIYALTMSGNITTRDKEIAESLGLGF